jgi:hypothetical protein
MTEKQRALFSPPWLLAHYPPSAGTPYFPNINIAD